MAKEKFPVTPATRFLTLQTIKFESFLYEYIDKGGTKQTSIELGVEENLIVKTIVVIDESKSPSIILISGDKEVSLKSMARQLGRKEIHLCPQDLALKITGYQFGGTSPFGTLKKIPIYHQIELEELDSIYINGGKRGYIIKVDTKTAFKVLNSKALDVAQ
jgi:Cys-tRNA(Pro) deacylase